MLCSGILFVRIILFPYPTLIPMASDRVTDQAFFLSVLQFLNICVECITFIVSISFKMNFSKKYVIILLPVFSFILCRAQIYEPPLPAMASDVLRNFINLHIQYPSTGLQNKEEGTVKIGFATDTKGNMMHREVLVHVSPALDSAALRLFDLILWKPAKNYGKPANGEGIFKIKYNAKKYKSLVKKRGFDAAPVPYMPIDTSRIIYSLKSLDKVPYPLIDSSFKSLGQYISSKLVFPEAAAKLNIKGTVKLQFVIETNGLPSNIIVLEPVGGGCTEEAVGIVEQLKWFPGLRGNKAVRAFYPLSIKFDPADQLKNKYIPNQANSGI